LLLAAIVDNLVIVAIIVDRSPERKRDLRGHPLRYRRTPTGVRAAERYALG